MTDPVTRDPVSSITLAVEALLTSAFSTAWTIQHVPLPLTLKEFARIVQSLPWIGIGWTQSDPGSEAGRLPIYRHDLQLVFIMRNQVGPNRFFGDALGPGLYPSIDAAARLLHGRAIDDIGTLTVGKTSQAYSDAYGEMDLAVGLIEFSAFSSLSPVRSLDDLPDFARLAATWDFDQGSTGPADSLTDIITPEGTT